MATILSITLNAAAPGFATVTLNRASGFFGNYFGYGLTPPAGGAFGSLSDDTFFMSTQCVTLQTTSVTQMQIAFAGTHAQTWFTSIETSLGTFLTANASFNGSGPSVWTWNTSNAGHFPGTGSELIQINV